MIKFDMDNEAFVKLLNEFTKEAGYSKQTYKFMVSAIKKKNYKNKQLQMFTNWMLKLDVKSSYFEYQQAESTAAEKYRAFVINLAAYAKTCKSQQAVTAFLKDQVMPGAIKQRISEFSKIAWYFRTWEESAILDCLVNVNKKDLLKAISNKAADPVTYTESAAAGKKTSAPADGDSDVTESSAPAASSVKVEVTRKEESESEKESRLIGDAIITLEEAQMVLIDSDELEEVNTRLKMIINNNIKIINKRLENAKKRQKAA